MEKINKEQKEKERGRLLFASLYFIPITIDGAFMPSYVESVTRNRYRKQPFIINSEKKNFSNHNRGFTSLLCGKEMMLEMIIESVGTYITYIM